MGPVAHSFPASEEIVFLKQFIQEIILIAAAMCRRSQKAVGGGPHIRSTSALVAYVVKVRSSLYYHTVTKVTVRRRCGQGMRYTIAACPNCELCTAAIARNLYTATACTKGTSELTR